eukprot:CAMPEP_0206217478 /NCGR_PEP_ID=MMETSP0047_2-20121206/3296_1 /ASSEMBLY_ACC=CAM_ASM_000192 /TAXON_ID=195065 /ORGANISM="Chroomonas mesostigmatica_cf, Strain CCMP1168" /LENGTH=31 /DNA_ID= /DNA_START= /DNA_END= /DNA_ORIENTATION=
MHAQTSTKTVLVRWDNQPAVSPILPTSGEQT